MRKFFLLVALTLLSAVFSVSSLAQTTPPAQVTSKIVIVDTSAFFKEKTGINKIINASKQLDVEFTPKRNELEQMAIRSQNLQKEIDTFQKSVQNKIPIDQKAAQAKVDELDKIQREGKFKQDEYNKLIEKRQNEILGPPFAETMKVLAEYIKSKGYGLVFDVSKDQTGMLIFATEQYDITRDFIAFYNSRPATTTTPATTPRPAATTTPKPAGTPIKP